MPEITETDHDLFTHQLRRDRCACLALACTLKKLAEEPEGDMIMQMDLLYGVACLLDLVGFDVDQVYLGLMNAQPAVGG